MIMAVRRRTVLRLLAGGVAATGAAIAAPAHARARTPVPDDAVGLLYDSLRCIGCRACVRACKDAHGLPADVVHVDGVAYDAPPDLNATTKTIVKCWKEGPLSAFVKTQCMHCVDPACTSVCMLGALHKGARGVVAYDLDKCVGCRYCQVACAFNVPRFEWDSATPRIVKCELCRHRWPDGEGAACAEVCPRGAVLFGTLADIRAEAHRRMREIPGRYHPHVYGEREGGGTQVLMLSGVAFEKLGLPDLGDEPVADLSETIQRGVYAGFVAPAALYAALAFVVVRNRKQGSSEGEER
jgi:Fe-S-cluster-containing dehydrogenase component